MAAKSTSSKQKQQVSSNSIALKSQRHPKKFQLSQRYALCLSVLVLSFSATSAALAFVDLGTTGQIVDIYGRVTGDKDAKSVSGSLDTVDDYLREAQDFYRNISQNNVTGTIEQIESILGELGIISPSSYPRTLDDILKGKIVLDGTAATPEQIYTQQQIIIDTANSDQFWIYTDSMLGSGENEGQSRLQAMNKASVESVQATFEGEKRSTAQSGKAAQNAEVAQSASTSSEQLSKKAQGRKVSQDILKDVAAQQALLARSNSAVSSQLAAISDQQSISSGQLAQLATQSQVSNQHLSQLQVGQSMGNIQLHDIFNAQRHANQMTVMEGQKNAQLSLGSTDAIYIPGLFAGQAASK